MSRKVKVVPQEEQYAQAIAIIDDLIRQGKVFSLRRYLASDGLHLEIFSKSDADYCKAMYIDNFEIELDRNQERFASATFTI